MIAEYLRYGIEYLVVALVMVYADALQCFAMRVRFRFLPNLGIALIWPLSMVFGLFTVTRLTRHLPKGNVL